MTYASDPEMVPLVELTPVNDHRGLGACPVGVLIPPRIGAQTLARARHRAR